VAGHAALQARPCVGGAARITGVVSLLARLEKSGLLGQQKVWFL
jgi:hypothetical protein